MMSLFRYCLGITLRLAIVAVCGCAIWQSWKIARADHLFREDTRDSIRQAIQLVPDQSEYYVRLSQFRGEHPTELLTEALRLNRYNAQAFIELGLESESQGDVQAAEKYFLDAFEVDHTYVPRWTLANFYLRRDDAKAFWFWARRAAEMPSDDIAPLFDLCWRITPDADAITSSVVPDNPDTLRQFTAWLLSNGQLHTASTIAPRLIAKGDPTEDRAILFAAVSKLAAAGNGTDSKNVWNLLVRAGWAPNDSDLLKNGRFARKPLPVSFDWRLFEYTGLHSWPGPSGLQIEFTGRQPEQCIIAEQFVPVNAESYSMQYTYHTYNIAAPSGLHWQIEEPASKQIVAESSDIASDNSVESRFDFSIPKGISIVRVRLMYKRVIGTTRIAGSLMMKSSRIQPRPVS